MLIETMPAVLAWSDPGEILDRVHASYIELLCDALGALLKQAEAEAPEAYARLQAELDGASDAAFMRVLQAPETSYRLIWRREGIDERAGFVADALRVEAALDGGNGDGDCLGGWTALGDIGFGADAARRDNPRLACGVPFDVMSPHAAAVDLAGPSALAPRRPFTGPELALVVAKLDEAFAGICGAGDVFRDFVTRFNMVLIAQIDKDDEDLFTSGSTGQYIGRSFITNPHMAIVRPIDLAEAMVHEGIHALLYMQERRVAWVHWPELFDPAKARVASPWTGSILGARPFLQACFVWYGLLHFWAAALGTGAFCPDQVRGRMLIALKGFLAGPLEQRIEEFRDGVDGTVLTAVREMQDRILRSWPAG
ncbi:MAG: hypothetical protein JWM38_1907 [Sphingomonas bacterium]|nr:hypothetical protein [Sphingomonas bacterium]